MNSEDYPTTNDFFWFEKFQNAPANSSLVERCLTFDGPNGIDAFIADAKSGNLPELSWVFSPGSLQEHPPDTMQDGEFFTRQIVEAVLNGPDYNETIFFLTYDGKTDQPHNHICF
jgi:phospholipase C